MVFDSGSRNSHNRTVLSLHEENAQLRARLRVAEKALEAIRVNLQLEAIRVNLNESLPNMDTFHASQLREHTDKALRRVRGEEGS